VQKAQKDLISNIEKAAKMAVEEGEFRKDLDVEQFAWTLYSFVLGYHHFKRMLEDPKAELHLKRSFKGLLEIAMAKDAAKEESSPARPGATARRKAGAAAGGRRRTG
jgi:hypothetical protein